MLQPPTKTAFKKHLPIALILATASLVRLVGIGYGLPLWVVGDEPSFIFGALKMIELKTLLPVLHQAEFSGIFYYTPYLPYLCMTPFVFLLGTKFLFFSGSAAEFKNYLISDLSHFFIAARLLSVLFAAGTVWLVYKIGMNLFKNKFAALFAAAFLSLALLHVNFSHWARHWVPVTFFFSLIIYVLSHPDFSVRKRYLLATLISGISLGITQQAGLALFFIALWFFLHDRLSLFQEVKRKWFWQAMAIFSGLAFLAFIVWPKGFYVARGAPQAIFANKNLGGLLAGYSFHFLNLLRSEPVFLFFIIIGFILSYFKFHSYFLTVSGFILLYIATFYLVFLQADRFILMLYPLLALQAGYGLHWIRERLANYYRRYAWGLVLITFIPMLLSVLKLDYLLIRNDTRVQAREWINSVIPEKTRILVLVPQMRLTSLPEAIKEQQAIDPASLRSIDLAEQSLDDKFFSGARFHVLHLNSVSTPAFFEKLTDYIAANKYQYVVFNPDFASEKGVLSSLNTLGATVRIFKGFKNRHTADAITEGFGDGWREILTSANIGPDIIVKKL